MPPTYLGIGDPYLGGKLPINSRNTGEFPSHHNMRRLCVAAS